MRLLLRTTRNFRLVSKMSSVSDSYINKVRLMEYWNQSDHALESEFQHSEAFLMVDKEPLVEFHNKELKLVRFETTDLRNRLDEFGLAIGLLNSCLLDVVEPTEEHKDYRPLFGCAVRTMSPPPDSQIDANELRKRLGNSLGGHFRSLRMTMLTLQSESDQNYLSRFQALTRWSLNFRRCPICTSTLRYRLSKFSAKCIRCQKDFYPPNSPVAICLVRDESNERCLLVKHLGSLPTVYTLVAGFSIPGENIQETVRREVAEETGIVCRDIQSLNYSQSWPLPHSSLMLPFTAVASQTQQLNISPGELESCGWFTRSEVSEALERTRNDPFLKGVLTTTGQNDFNYVPPKGAIAHRIIDAWITGKF